jgi:hypothetical protein
MARGAQDQQGRDSIIIIPRKALSPYGEFFELAHLGQSSKRNTLLQKLHTAATRL